MDLRSRSYESVQELFKNVSKNDRHTVWATMHKEVLYVIHHIMKAAETTSPTTKKKALEKVQIQLASLRIPLIFCAKTKIMNMQQYKGFDETIDELRRMAYGWNRSIRP